MTRDDITRMAREAGLAYGSDEKPLGSVTRFAALVAAAEREKVARWHIGSGYTTGHGDAVEDLLKELEWQIREREREACAKVCENLVLAHPGRADMTADQCATAIRARK